MVLAESMALAFAGGFLGLILTWAVIRWTAIGIGVEGIQVSFVMTSAVIFEGLVLIFICALVAGALPALRVARRGALESLRSVG